MKRSGGTLPLRNTLFYESQSCTLLFETCRRYHLVTLTDACKAHDLNLSAGSNEGTSTSGETLTVFDHKTAVHTEQSFLDMLLNGFPALPYNSSAVLWAALQRNAEQNIEGRGARASLGLLFMHSFIYPFRPSKHSDNNYFSRTVIMVYFLRSQTKQRLFPQTALTD